MHHGPDSPLSFALRLEVWQNGTLLNLLTRPSISLHLFAVVQPHNPSSHHCIASSKLLAIHPVATIAAVPKGQLHRGFCSLSGRLGKLHHRSRRLRSYAYDMLMQL